MMASMYAMEGYKGKKEVDIIPETDEQREQRIKKEKIEIYKSQGLTEFFYGNNSLWALNKKNADKKAKKRNWL